ncbi:MAG: hypothetical protein LBR54_03005, partial [Oscillospiraceae bacterium]|nr:hypothetical protein [Oscillospiraceae bacterium]
MKNRMSPLLIFIIGAAAYPALEIILRGFSHISMAVAGGISLLMMLEIDKLNIGIPLKAILGGLFITCVEFSFGCLVNLWLGLSVWDYKHETFH